MAWGCTGPSLPGGWPAHVTEGSLARGRPGRRATGCAKVRIGVRFPFRNVGSDFGHGRIATVVKDVQILFGLGNTKAAERALQFLVVYRGDGDGRVAVSQGALVVFGGNVFVPQVLCARPVPAAVGWQGALVGGRRWDADERAGVSDGRGAVTLPLVGLLLARRRGRARVGRGRRSWEVLLTHGAGGPDDLDDAAVLVDVLPAVLGAVVRRGWVWFFGAEVGLRLRRWDTHSLHVNVHQEVQLLLHRLNLQNTTFQHYILRMSSFQSTKVQTWAWTLLPTNLHQRGTFSTYLSYSETTFNSPPRYCDSFISCDLSVTHQIPGKLEDT